MSYLRTVALPALAIAMLASGAAQSHPRLLSASPAISVTTVSPPRIGLRFSEQLVPAFSRISLTDGRGNTVPLKPPSLTPDHKSLSVEPRARLATGTYNVRWQAVSKDTHRIAGKYEFTVR